MKKDTDLDPLRGREDFKKLLAGAGGEVSAEEEVIAIREADRRMSGAFELPGLTYTEVIACRLVAGFQVEWHGGVRGNPQRQGRQRLTERQNGRPE